MKKFVLCVCIWTFLLVIVEVAIVMIVAMLISIMIPSIYVTYDLIGCSGKPGHDYLNVALSANGAPKATHRSDLVRSKRDLIELGQFLTHETGRSALDFADYGCYCGYGGYGTPIDNLDKCCQAHDDCYGNATLTANCWPKWDRYLYTFVQFKIKCSASPLHPCYHEVCMCDKGLATCLKEGLKTTPYNKQHERLSRTKCYPKHH